jgi:asparagine synthase (glutamine-hydrolysing)
MCGIAGLICTTQTCSEEAHSALVGQMCDLQRHRGPDDRGTVVLGNVCLGAVRLSIIDLSAAGHMPMPDDSGRWWITYNGEVYNFREIREELLRCGHIFRSYTDTEVVLHAFKEWGEACLQRFVGMFAFAVYDRYTDTMTLVRDRFGVKPLYYTQYKGHLLFSSEIKALLRVYDGPRLNKQRLLEWLLYRNVDILSPETLLEDINAVLPGHIVTIQRGRVSARQYYAPHAQVQAEEYQRAADKSSNAVVADIEAALEQSVRDRLVSDVPLGTLCSGGLDSSLITAIAARHCEQERITAFHVSVAGYPALDEKVYAEQVATHVGADLLCTELSGPLFRRELPRAIYLSDVPLTHPNSVAFLLICELARAHGVTVLLSGEGADELFGGYDWRYRRCRTVLWAQRVLQFFPRKLRKAIELAGYISGGLPVTSFHFDQMLPHAVMLLDKGARREAAIQCALAYAFVAEASERAILGATLSDLSDFLTPLLRRLDRMSMGASIECRVPFLDHRLVQKVVNLPLSYRVSRRTDKWVLKQIATRYLPPDIVHRKKAGFPLPIRDYIAPLARPELFNSGFCCEVIGMQPRIIQEILSSWQEHVRMVTTLISLEIWGRMYIMQEPVDHIRESIEKFEHSHTFAQ